MFSQSRNFSKIDPWLQNNQSNNVQSTILMTSIIIVIELLASLAEESRKKTRTKFNYLMLGTTLVSKWTEIKG